MCVLCARAQNHAWKSLGIEAPEKHCLPGDLKRPCELLSFGLPGVEAPETKDACLRARVRVNQCTCYNWILCVRIKIVHGSLVLGLGHLHNVPIMMSLYCF